MGLEFDKKKYFFIFKMADEIILLFIQYYKTISKIVEIFQKIIYWNYDRSMLNFFVNF